MGLTMTESLRLPARAQGAGGGLAPTDELTLLCVVAHPDDETLGFGGTLARYAAEGVATVVVSATRGERGWQGDPGADPGPAALGVLREGELRAAAARLGVADVAFLDYTDGELDRVPPGEAVARVVDHIRRVRPQVVLTFGPDGAYGHPDHIAISQLTTTAVAYAADPVFDDGSTAEPHRVAKLYYRIWPAAELALYEAAFGETTIDVDGERRAGFGWPNWAATTRLDTSACWTAVRAAVFCHRSQVSGSAALTTLPPEAHQALWGTQHFYRAMSAVGGGHGIEDDLFAGLRFGSARPANGLARAGVGSSQEHTVAAGWGSR